MKQITIQFLFLTILPTRCFQRIYFSPNGSIDYYLFNFLGKGSDELSQSKQKEFERLLSIFIKKYKFPLTAKVKFAQCSSATFMPW